MNRYKGIETQIKHLQTIEESGQINQYAQGKLNALLEVMDLVKGDEVLDPVSKRLFEVSYFGEDEYGSIIKGVEIVAESEEDAMSKAKEINRSEAIYSATETTAC